MNRTASGPSVVRQVAADEWVRLSAGMTMLGLLALLPVWPDALRQWYHTTGIGTQTLGTIIAAMFVGLPGLPSRRERQFWALIGSAFALLLGAGLLLGEGPVPEVLSHFGVRQGAYWLAYAMMLLASEWGAHLPDDGHRPATRVGPLRRLGLVIVSLVIFVNLVVVPSWSGSTPSDLLIASGWMFVVMAGATTARFLYAWRLADTRRWRWLYGGMATGCALLTFTDAQGLGAHGYGRPWEWIGDPTDVTWLVFGLVFVATARLRHVPIDDHHEDLNRPSPFHDTLTTSRFLLGATVVVPVGHLILSGFDALPRTISPFTLDAVVAATTIGLAVMTWRSLETLLADALVRVNGTIGHDLKGMAFVFSAFTDFVRARTSDRPDVLLGLQHLQDTTAALSALATQLQRPQVAEPSAILQVHQTLTHLEPRLRALLPSDVRLTLRCEAQDDRISMATEDLERVLVNLVQNAVSAMPMGGTVTVSTGNCLRGMPPAPHVALTVADMGRGMAPEVLAQVFTPGFSTGAHGGTGLGLVSVQQCLYRAGGAVDVASTPGKGTVVTLSWRALSD